MGNNGPMPLTLETIQEIACGVIQEFEREKNCALHKDDLQAAKNCLAKEEGIERLVRILEGLASAPAYRQLIYGGCDIDVSTPN